MKRIRALSRPWALPQPKPYGWETYISVKNVHWIYGIIFTECWINLKLGTNKMKFDLKPLPIKFVSAQPSSNAKSTSETKADLPPKWNLTVTKFVKLIKPIGIQDSILLYFQQNNK